MTDDVRDVNTKPLTPLKSLRSTQPQVKPVIRRPRHLTIDLQRNLPVQKGQWHRDLWRMVT